MNWSLLNRLTVLFLLIFTISCSSQPIEVRKVSKSKVGIQPTFSMHDLLFYKKDVSRFDSSMVIEGDSCEAYAAQEKMKNGEVNFRQIFSSCLVSLGWLLLEWNGEKYKVLDYPVEKI